MSIADTDIPIPSTASLLDVAYRRQSPDEVRVARAREAGQRIGPCPTCGWEATYEDVTIHRPGQPDVVRTLARCLRRRLGPQCPVETVAEALRPESPLSHLEGSLGAFQPVGLVIRPSGDAGRARGAARARGGAHAREDLRNVWRRHQHEAAPGEVV